MLDDKFVSQIAKIAQEATAHKPELMEIDGRIHLLTPPNWKVADGRARPDAAVAIEVGTLTGLIDLLKSGEAKPGSIVHVESPTTVKVLSPLTDPFRTRESLYVAEAELPKIVMSQYQTMEPAIIMLRTCFVQDENMDALVKFLGNITQEDVKTSVDDGFSQTAIARVGIAKVAEVPVPPAVELAPYRTFLDIVNQPKSKFLCRLQKGPNGPTVAFFEADGGKWRLEAIALIRDLLHDSVGETFKVVA